MHLKTRSHVSLKRYNICNVFIIIIYVLFERTLVGKKNLIKEKLYSMYRNGEFCLWRVVYILNAIYLKK